MMLTRHAVAPGAVRVSAGRNCRITVPQGLARRRVAAHRLVVSSSSEVKEEVVGKAVDVNVDKFVKQTAATFAPRASGATKKNPAQPGTVLYTIFEVQAWLSVAVGGLLSFNVIFPTDEPSVARLMGMWSIWMFTVPSLRARDCSKNEKDALNLLFLLIPLANVLIPFFWKNFGAVFSADCILLAGVFYQKGAFNGGFAIVDEPPAEEAAVEGGEKPQ